MSPEASKEPLTVQGDEIAPGETSSYSYTLPEEATLDGLTVICYSGQAWELEYRVEIYDKSADRTTNVLNDIAGVQEIGGNADHYDFNVRKELSEGDEIRVEVENVSSEYTYTTNLIADIEYGGSLLARLAEALS